MWGRTMSARVVVIRFPGSNCEAESVRALERVGLTAEIRRWNEPSEVFERFDAFLLPGGFSYQDRIRAGAIAARLPVLDVLARKAEQGAPIVGLCNGAQILVESGLVNIEEAVIDLALAPNFIEGRHGYYTRWVVLLPGAFADRCLFTRTLKEPAPVPMAHGEGRFITRGAAARAGFTEQIALAYGRPDGSAAEGFPWIPNGSLGGAAGVRNRGGNVLALMPHPERAQVLAQVPEDFVGAWGERRRAAKSARELEADGPGLFLFRALAAALGSERAGLGARA